MRILLALLALVAPAGAQIELRGTPASALNGTVACDSSNAINVDSGNLYLDCSTNELGLGDASPDARLEVVPAGTDTYSLLVSSANGSTNELAFDVGNDEWEVAANEDITGSLKFDNVVAMSSAPVAHVAGVALANLASGTTIQAFTPDSAITLRRLTGTTVIAGIAGAGDILRCGTSDASNCQVTMDAAQAAGARDMAVCSIAIALGTEVACWLTSDAATKPAFNFALEYVMQ